MKALLKLKKIYQYKIDEIAKAIAAKESELRENENALNAIIEEEEFEKTKYFGSKLGFALENYLKETKLKKQRIESTILNIKKQLDNLRMDLYEEFSNIKKIEIMIENYAKKENIRLNKIENKELDEFNITKFNVQ